ncbi:MAG: hypothetical protein FJX72_14795, partial [Armatimonadetes bacterium]|nr:hypothetical protein [Armatimonadota bacterium]
HFPAVRRALLAATGAAPVRPSWDAARLSPLFRLALPLGITNALNLLYFHVARLVVVRYHGEGDLGIYAASAQIAAAGYLVTAAMATAVAPRMARLFADRQWAAFARLMVVFGGVSLVLGAATLLVGAIAGGALLTVLYTPEYAKQPAVLLWLLGAAAINFISTCFGTALTVSRHFNIQLALGIVSVATALLVSVWLVPRIGMVGAGIAAAATSSVRLVGLGAMFWVAFSRAKRPPPVDDGATAAWLGGK